MHKTRSVVCYPKDFDETQSPLQLMGFYHRETNYYVIVDKHIPGALQLNNCPDIPRLRWERQNNVLEFFSDNKPCVSNSYSVNSDLFSRHQGLIETDQMLGCKALICGCGSVGSLVALELARSGIGNFMLIDADILSIENLCRHQCSISDVGRRKAYALSDRIQLINPWAQSHVHEVSLESLDPDQIASFATPDTVFVGCADSRRADYYLARLASRLNVPFVSIGLWERAFAGEIFYQLPESDHPCYTCAFDGLAGSLSHRHNQRRPFYTTEVELRKLDFQPAISIDISFVTQIGLKLIIDILSRKRAGYVPRVLGSLSQYTLVCNTNDPRLGGPQAEIFSHPLQVTTSIEMRYSDSCPPCQFKS